MKQIAYALLPSNHFERAQNFYDFVGYGGLLDLRDTIFVALDNDNIVGIVRLASEHDTLVLRGMQVADDYRRQGIGTV